MRLLTVRNCSWYSIYTIEKGSVRGEFSSAKKIWEVLTLLVGLVLGPRIGPLLRKICATKNLKEVLIDLVG